MFAMQTLVVLIGAVTVVDYCQESTGRKPNAAERLFRDCEKKLLDAKSVEIAIKTPGDNVTLKTNLVAVSGNKLALSFGGEFNDGKSIKWQSISDGV